MNKRTLVKVFLVVSLILSLTSCVSDRWDAANPLNRMADRPEEIIPAKKSLCDVSSYAVMLQGDIFDELANLQGDLLVIDYSRDGTGKSAYTQSEIEELHVDTGAVILSYLSIGEAERYRDYFKSSWLSGIKRKPYRYTPAWISCENPDWEGNYPVRYWIEEWQQIVLDNASLMMNNGFDGVFLDIVDAFEYWADPDCTEEPLDREVTATYMVDFVVRIAEHIRSIDPEAIIIVQNAEYILHYADARYLAVIDGLNLESLYFKDQKEREQERTDKRFFYIDQFQDAGVAICAIDYIYDGDSGSDLLWYTDLTKEDGVIGYPAHEDVSLKGITPHWVYQ